MTNLDELYQNTQSRNIIFRMTLWKWNLDLRIRHTYWCTAVICLCLHVPKSVWAWRQWLSSEHD